MTIANKLNFSAGPGALPDNVLLQTQQAIVALPETGISVLGMSHRSDWFKDVVDETEGNLRKLLSIPKNYHVLLLQGGSSLQFSMIPMHFLKDTGKVAEFIVSGYWSKKAPVEAQYEGQVKVVWDGTQSGYRHLPSAKNLDLSENAAYLHYVSNETVEGLQFSYMPGLKGVPLICDMASDILSQPIPVEQFDLIYAHAQKNLGPAGVTLVIIKDEFLQSCVNQNLPTFLDFRTHIQSKSIYNTPPVFAIYTTMLVTRWLLNDIGNLDNMAKINNQKASAIYHALDLYNDFYNCHADKSVRSKMNVAFNIKDQSLEKAFIESATQQGFYGLEGHRSIGGLRASLYNAVTLEAAELLASFLKDFANQHSSV
jgi:phosphoserine aminotransferase